MRILADTNVLLWFLSDNEKLSRVHREALESSENQVCVSIVSLWEIVIKLNIGKSELDEDFETFFSVITEIHEFEILQISANHLFRYSELPLRHRDPFDRLIYAQATTEKMLFLFTDEVFDLYESYKKPLL